MATHREIEAVEKPLIDALNHIRHNRPYDITKTQQAAHQAIQLVTEERTDHKRLLSRNWNHYGTLKVNAQVLADKTHDTTLKSYCQKLAKLL